MKKEVRIIVSFERVVDAKQSDFLPNDIIARNIWDYFEERNDFTPGVIEDVKVSDISE